MNETTQNRLKILSSQILSKPFQKIIHFQQTVKSYQNEKEDSEENKNQTIIFEDSVKKALLNNLPIVALESTIISHGMVFNFI
jgi:hypothetical protein